MSAFKFYKIGPTKIIRLSELGTGFPRYTQSKGFSLDIFAYKKIINYR